jgi:hypothetical protein
LLVTISILGQACSDTVQGGIIMAADSHGDAKYKFDSKNLDGSTDDDVNIDDPDILFGDANVGCKRVIIPQLDITTPLALPANNTPAPIYVTVVDYAAQGPASEVPVKWEIVENDGINGKGPGALGSMVSVTDDKNGATYNTFNPNKGPATHYKIKLSTECAEDVFIDIQVAALPTGKIEVKLLYDNQIPLGNIVEHIVPAPFACASFKAILPPTNYVASKTTYFGDVSQIYGPLPAEKKYGVFVIGKDLAGHLAAAGCADAVLVNDQQTTTITIQLSVLPLQASGQYDMINHFDFTGAIPGQLGQILDTAVQIFYDPGTFIIEQIKNLVKQFLGAGFIVDAVFSLFEKQLAKFVTDWLLNSSPSWLQDFFQMGQDVLQIVKKLEMLGVLKVFKVGSDFFFNGEIDFTGVNLWWHLGCDKNDPNFATCGTKISFDLTQVSTDPNFPFDLMSGKLSGSISQQTHMSIDSSTITLNYGKLILYVLTNVVLKKITGQTSFVAAMQQLIDCQGLGKSLSGIIGGLGQGQITSICNSTISLIVLPIESMLGGLSLDSGLSLKGDCTMVDDPDKDGNYDLKVDRLIDGVWAGNINIQGSSGKTFKGDFTATRQPGF